MRLEERNKKRPDQMILWECLRKMELRKTR